MNRATGSISKLSLEQRIVGTEFTFIGINLNADGVSSWRAYECNKCKEPVRYTEAMQHYQNHYKPKTDTKQEAYQK